MELETRLSKSVTRNRPDSQDLKHVGVPPHLGARLQEVFSLEQTPTTLEDLAQLARTRNSKTLQNPGMNRHFQAIFEGAEIFGSVDYETRHKVKSRTGKEAYTACALDALIQGCFQPTEIVSKCFHCDQQIHLTMSNGNITSAEPMSIVLWLGASESESCNCETEACPYINFFSSEHHARDWKAQNPNQLGMILTIGESLELARRGWWNPVRTAMES